MRSGLMAFTFMPGQFRDRADFYQQIATLIGAGFGLPNALEELRDNPPARGYRRPLDQILIHLRDGATFAEALRQTGTWMSAFDVALLEAGEKSGRLDSCLKLLAHYYEERTRLAQTVLSEMAYPVFLLHAALFILGFPELFRNRMVWCSARPTSAARCRRERPGWPFHPESIGSFRLRACLRIRLFSQWSRSGVRPSPGAATSEGPRTWSFRRR